MAIFWPTYLFYTLKYYFKTLKVKKVTDLEALFWTDWQQFLKKVPSFVFGDFFDQDRNSFIGYTGKFLRLHPEIMSCALGWWHVESRPSTTTNIISLLPQCLWPPNLAGWWLTMRSSQIFCPGLQGQLWRY